jgi:hypothetical protein
MYLRAGENFSEDDSQVSMITVWVNLSWAVLQILHLVNHAHPDHFELTRLPGRQLLPQGSRTNLSSVNTGFR